MSAPIAERLASELVGWCERPLDGPVEARATALLRDYLGVTLGGAPEPSSLALRRGLAGLGTHGTATVIGTSEALAPIHAALANGAAAHARGDRRLLQRPLAGRVFPAGG